MRGHLVRTGIPLIALVLILCLSLIPACTNDVSGAAKTTLVNNGGGDMAEKVTKTTEEWRQVLTPEQYEVMRNKGTERAFTGKYYDFHEEGIYKCAACGNELFSSAAKFDSGSGWPSFFAPVSDRSIETFVDASEWMIRTEVTCWRCGGHLGHVFEDGPPPTGLRYCINSVALDFSSREL